MFENFNNLFEGKFGKIAPGMCRLSASTNSGIAVKTSTGYKTYDIKAEKLTNVSNFCFNISDDAFFVIPTSRVQVGDIILVNGKPKCVTEVDKKTITVINYEDSTIERIVPTRQIFMGNTYFYGKIVSIFGNMFSKGKGLSSMMKMMMFSQMMGGNNGSSNDSNNGFMGNMGQMMAMSMLMGKDSNPFDGMFDFDLDLDAPLDGDDTEDTEEGE